MNNEAKIGWSALDPDLRATGEAVSRLAIELAKVSKKDGNGFDVESELEDAWKILRHACLIVDTTGRKQTVDDYKQFRIKPSKEVWERIKPPEPPPSEPQREKFDRLFIIGGKPGNVILKGPNENGDPDEFTWKQYSLGTGSDGDVKKAEGYNCAWSMINQRVCFWIDDNVRRYGLVDEMCHGRSTYSCEGDWWFCFVTSSDQSTGHCKTWISGRDQELFNATVKETPRPVNSSVGKRWSLDATENGKPVIFELCDAKLPGQSPPENLTAGELYEQLSDWAILVIKRWKHKVAKAEFERFWTEARHKGFLWRDVLDMAMWSKRHAKGIQWASGYRWRPEPEKSVSDQDRSAEISLKNETAGRNVSQAGGKQRESKEKMSEKE